MTWEAFFVSFFLGENHAEINMKPKVMEVDGSDDLPFHLFNL